MLGYLTLNLIETEFDKALIKILTHYLGKIAYEDRTNISIKLTEPIHSLKNNPLE